MKVKTALFSITLLIAVFMGLIFLIINEIKIPTLNAARENKTKSLISKDKKAIKSVTYENIDITDLIKKKGESIEKLLDSEKLLILKRVGKEFKENEYIPNKETNATYKSTDLGRIQKLEETPPPKLLDLEGLKEEKISITNEVPGIVETRVNVYELCKLVFKYYLCIKNKNINLKFENYGKKMPGVKPNDNLSIQEVVNKVLEQHPDLRTYIRGRILLLISENGINGSLPVPSSYSYNKNFDITESYKKIGKKIENYDSKDILEVFSFLYKYENFTPYTEAKHPSYKKVKITWLEKGKAVDDLSNDEILKILGWKNENLSINYI